MPTLTGTTHRPWLDRDGLVGSALACADGDFALVLVQRTDGSAAPVPAEAFAEVLDADPASVWVTLPAWKFTFRADVTAQLKELGLRTAFSLDADFSPMTTQEALHLDFVVHEAVIEVTAQGIEAAAATGGGMAGAAAPSKPEHLLLDRPFGYALMHVPTRTMLFLGRLVDPRATE